MSKDYSAPHKENPESDYNGTFYKPFPSVSKRGRIVNLYLPACFFVFAGIFVLSP